MQRLILFLSFLFFLVPSCKKGLPDGIIKKDEFVDLMTQVHILDGYINTMPIDSARKVIDPLYVQLLAKYKLDTVGFKQNVIFYMGNPKLSTEAYGTIIKNLEKEEKKFYTTDSLNNIRFQDSVARAIRTQRRFENVMRMISNAKGDSVKITPSELSRRFFELTGVQSIVEKNFYHGLDSVSPPAILPDSVKRGSTALPELPALVKPDSIVPDSLKPDPKKNRKFKPVQRTPILLPSNIQ